jgi:hypothetical protein
VAQWAQVLIQDTPYQFVIEAEIFMRELVPESGNLPPANGGVGTFQRFNAIILEGLPDNFEVAQKRVADDTVFEKVVFVERLQSFGDEVDAI